MHIDLTVEDSFTVLRVMYDIDSDRFSRVRAELVEMLDLGDLMTQPFRQLSLGQRMRAEFAAAVLHTPEVLLLDEPTLGLDFEAQGPDPAVRARVRRPPRRRRRAHLPLSG